MKMDRKLATSNFQYLQETFKLKTKSEIDLIMLGERLNRIMSERLYEPNYDTFNEFLEDLKLSPATASKLINIHLKFIVEFGFKPEVIAQSGGWSPVSEILPIVESKREATKWLRKVRILTRIDLRKEILEKKTGILMSECKHKNVNKFMLTVCLDCGDKFREYDEQEK